MEEKRLEPSDDKKCVEPLAGQPDEKVECDEVLSRSESAEITEKSDSSGRGTDEKLSPMPSESSSGIEMKSESLLSQEPTLPAESAAKGAKPSTEEGAEGSTTEATLPAESAAMDVKPSTEEGAVGGTAEPTSPAESAAVDAKPSTEEGAVGGMTEPTSVAVESAAKPPFPACILDEKIEVIPEVSPPEKSKKRGSLVRGAINYFKRSPHKKDSSPTEKTGMLSRFRLSKSVSSPEKPLEATVEEPREHEGEAACTTPEEEEAFKKGAEKKPVLKRLAKSISSVFKHKSSSSGETEGLVTDQDEPEPAPVAVSSPAKAEDLIAPEEEKEIKRIYWTEGRQSLTQRPSLSLTEQTDLPSSFTGVDVFSRRQSEGCDNTSEEALAGSFSSSLLDIKEIESDEKSASPTSAAGNEAADANDEKPEESAEKNAEAKTDESPASGETEKKAEAVEQEKPSAESLPDQQDKAEMKDAETEEPKETTVPEKPADADKTE